MSTGIRDDGLLDSALARPLNIYNYENTRTLTELAAAYGFGIARNHAFVDGNKRAALMAIGLFLNINGYKLTAGQAETITVIMGVASGDIDETDLAAWLAANVAVR